MAAVAVELPLSRFSLEHHTSDPTARPPNLDAHGYWVTRSLHRDMPPISLRHATAPSPSLLRFLRAQSALRQPSCTAFPPLRCATLSRPRQSSSLSAASPRKSLARPAQLAAVSHEDLARSLHAVISRPSSAAIGTFTSSPDPTPFLPRNHALIPLVSRRTFSSTRPAPFLGVPFWKRGTRKSGAGPLQPNDLPPRHADNYAQDEGGNLGRVTRPINEPRIRCTEFDDNGNITLVNSEFRKSELIAKVRREATTIWWPGTGIANL